LVRLDLFIRFAKRSNRASKGDHPPRHQTGEHPGDLARQSGGAQSGRFGIAKATEDRLIDTSSAWIAPQKSAISCARNPGLFWHIFLVTAGASPGAEKPSKASWFQTTHWSIVLTAAGHADGPRRAEALEKLCRAYWYPLYAYVRRRGNGPEDAQDLTQEFFARLLEKNWLADIEPVGGHFRSFLLTALNRFLANEYDRNQSAKRGGGKQLISLDQEHAEERYLNEPTVDETPERIFERRWAFAVLDQALMRLRAETRETDRSRQFELLNPFLSREAGDGEYARVAAQLGISAGAVGVAVYRLRHRYRELVQAEIANTLVDPSRVDEEMRHLLATLCQ